jgi:two-component sensor histidine kinase
MTKSHPPPCFPVLAVIGPEASAVASQAIQRAISFIKPSTAAMLVVWGEDARQIAPNAGCRRMLAARVGRDKWESALQTLVAEILVDFDIPYVGDGRERRLGLPVAGGVFQIEAHASPICDGPSKPEGTLITLIERSREHDDVRDRTAQRDAEFRFRNIFTSLRSVVSGSCMTAESVEDVEMHLTGRVDALARIHSKLMRRQGTIGLDELIRDELAAAGGLLLNVSVDGPSCQLSPATSEALGLALHELTTNSIKFGSLGAPPAFLAISWGMEKPGGSLVIDWQETGVAVISAGPRRRGFGFSIIEDALAYDLNAAVDLAFAPGGFRCRISIPQPSL